MNTIGKLNNHGGVEIPAFAITGFRQLSLWAFVLLLPLCACSANTPGESAKAAAENTILEIEEESPLGRWGAILPIPEEVVDVGVGNNVYRNSEQEIIIQYSFGPYDARVTRFFNFSKGELEIECKNDECSKEAISRLNRLKEERISLAKYTRLGDVFRHRISGGPRCSTPMDEGYETLSPDGIVSYQKIIWLSTEKHLFFNFLSCDEKMPLVHAESLWFRFYPFDAVMLGVAVNNPVAIVFKTIFHHLILKTTNCLLKWRAIWRIQSIAYVVRTPGRKGTTNRLYCKPLMPVLLNQ